MMSFEFYTSTLANNNAIFCDIVTSFKYTLCIVVWKIRLIVFRIRELRTKCVPCRDKRAMAFVMHGPSSLCGLENNYDYWDYIKI